MKVTVSSTSMMKPILLSELTSSATKAHPQRVLGLLERTDKDSEHGPLFIHSHPHACNKTPYKEAWSSFMQIQDKQSQWCVAVFGFEFDGKNTWYQIWNLDNNQSGWVMHHSGIDYQPYAIMAMDALVSLLPDWNGELFWTIKPPHMSEKSSLSYTAKPNEKNNLSKKTYFQQRSRSFSGADRHCEVRISDAATSPTGKLWFLVTIQDEQSLGSCNSNDQLRTGWISH